MQTHTYKCKLSMLIAEEAEEAGRHGHTHARDCDSSESFLKVCVCFQIFTTETL
jgi:hypothetical protein